MFYGIDLGTTNSLIGREPDYLSDIVPSVVSHQTGEVGTALLEDPEATRSFKINMSMAIEGTLSVKSSTMVLSALKKQVKDDVVHDVVISVPAYFSDNQRQATVKAAEAAGLTVHGLVNEPTAAAMYILKDKLEMCLVYDLGGGTFDISAMDSRFGMFDVVASDGCIVGGDDFDQAIRKYLFKKGNVPVYKLNKIAVNKMLLLAKRVKETISTTEADCEVDLRPYGGEVITVTTDDYVQLMKLTFADTISKTRRVINESIPTGESFKIVLVGGSTKCPFLRRWIEEEIGVKPEPLSYDPDRVVAQGAALYASLVEKGEIDVVVSDVTTQLSIEMDDGSVKPIILKNSKIPVVESTFAVNRVPTKALSLKLYQGDSILASQNEFIGALNYVYGRDVDAYEGDVIVTVSVERSGVITLTCEETDKDPVSVKLDRFGTNASR